MTPESALEKIKKLTLDCAHLRSALEEAACVLKNMHEWDDAPRAHALLAYRAANYALATTEGGALVLAELKRLRAS